MLPGFPSRRPGLELDVPLAELNTVVIDFETTGLYPNQGDEIIEVGAVYVNGLEISSVEPFDRLVNPGRPVSPEAFKVHNIPDDLLAIQSPVGDVLPAFLSYLGDRVVVGQNIAFDLSFLVKALGYCHLPPLQNLVLDTKWLSRLAFPKVSHHGLDAIAQRLEIQRPPDRHRALGDAMFTAQILVELLKRCLERGYERVGDLLEAHEAAEGGRFGIGVLDQLERCFKYRTVAEIAYLGFGSQGALEATRKVSIYYLSPPYFLGFCHTRNAIRTFRIDRVSGVQALEDAYDIPEGFHPQDHFLRR